MNRTVYFILFVLFFPVLIVGFTFGIVSTYFNTGKAYAVRELLLLMLGVDEEAGE